MQTVTSSDGTRIAVWRTGAGPPLLLVHGATADHTTTWRFVRPELERRFTVHAMDRRGRGGSGDSPAYALQREAEDVAAVVESIGEAGDVEGMVVAMYRDVVEMPPGEIELLRSQRDAWAVRLANAPTMPRELRTEQRYVFEPERFREMRTRTLLLVGGDSPPRELENATGVAAALPDARVVVLPGQQHAAMYTAPDVFVREVVHFLEA